MRVCFYITHFFPFPTGATYSAYRLAQSLRRRGVDVEWVVDDRDGQWANGGHYDGFAVRSFYLARTGKCRKIRALFRLTQYVWRNGGDIRIVHIHGGGHMNLLVAAWIKWWFPSKKVLLKCTSDGWDCPEGIRREKYGPLLLYIYRRLDGLVAMTSGTCEKLRAAGGKGRVALIPNGTDTDRFTPDDNRRREARGELKIPQDAPVLVYLGWLGAGKGTDVLFPVWRELLKHHPDLHLMLVGDYRVDRDVEVELRTLLHGVGMEEHWLCHPQLIRIGHVENPEYYLRAADIFVFPSRREGFGTVQTEAMASGLPCVVNDLPGNTQDIIPDDSVGYRISGNDTDAYIRRLDELLRNPARRARMGRAARLYVQERFSMDSVARRYVSLYQEMTGST